MFIILYQSKLRYQFFCFFFFTFVLNKTEKANVIAYSIVMKKIQVLKPGLKNPPPQKIIILSEGGLSNKKSSDYLQLIKIYRTKIRSNKSNGRLYQLISIMKIPKQIQIRFGFYQPNSSIKIKNQQQYHRYTISKISLVLVYIQTNLSEPISNNKMIQKKEYKLLSKVRQNIGENLDIRETFLEPNNNQKTQLVLMRLPNNKKSIDFFPAVSFFYSNLWNRFFIINILEVIFN